MPDLPGCAGAPPWLTATPPKGSLPATMAHCNKKAGSYAAAPGLPPAALPTPSSSAKRNLISNGGLLLRLRHRAGGLGRSRHLRGRRYAGHPRHEHFAVATARLRRLERTSRVEIAVGQARNLLASTEMKVLQLRIADGPAAACLGQRLDRLALVERDHQLLGGRRVGLRIAQIELAQRRIADIG